MTSPIYAFISICCFLASVGFIVREEESMAIWFAILAVWFLVCGQETAVCYCDQRRENDEE